MKLKNETALITGSTSGIGKKIAELFLKEGAKVSICSRNEKNVMKTVSELQKSFGTNNVIGFSCDVSNINSISNVIEKSVEIFGSLRILVANAGLNNYYGPFSLLSHEIVKKDTITVLGVNLIGTINSISAVLPIMKEQNYGRIITLSGAGGDSKRPMPNMSIYSASKGGIVSFSRCLAEELKISKENIKINIFQPGMIKTNLGSNAILISDSIDEISFREQTELVHEYIGTDIDKSVLKIIPYILPECNVSGKIFRGYSLFKMIRGGMKLRKKLKNV